MEQLLTKNKFNEIKPQLNENILKAIDELGFKLMTPVQSSTIPQFLTHHDVTVQAATGSGKTLAFVIPILAILLRKSNKWALHDIGGVVISPTRELATQILKVFQHFEKFIPQLKVASIIGGSNQKTEWNNFIKYGGNIIVATPGRLESTLKNVAEFNAKPLEVLVLDEADRLLDMGFHNTLTQILSYFPRQRRTGLFSATQTREVKELVKAGLRNPVRIEVQINYKSDKDKNQILPQTIPTSLDNQYMIVNGDEKLSQLVHFLKQNNDKKIMIFFLSCACVDYFYKILSSLSDLSTYNIFSMHGKMVTKKRVRTFESFVNVKNGIMLSTDVVARGIDIPDIDWIIQYDAPQDPSFFVHRIGRTARMGKTGKAIIYLMPHEDTFIEFLKLKNVPIEERKKEEENVVDQLSFVKTMAESDRDIMEKGQKAFISYIRAYKEHKCNYVFVFHKLPFAQVATGFGLLYFPILPDLKHFRIQFKNHKVPPSKIKYKDPKREKQRLINLEVTRKKNEVEKQARLEREKQRKKQRKQAMKEKKKRKQKKRTHADMCAEWDDLQEEMRLMKKLKQGKITQKEYDDALLSID